ncbi:MAG: hypothetical protein AAFY02_19945 [Pseudomonadota bacterium]
MHPIYALWSHPRSMSTAMERVMRERGDLTCFHEPFMYDYYIHRQVRIMPHFDAEEGRPVSYEAVRETLLKAAEQGPVFMKDMSYYVFPRILEDRALSERLVNHFLIRDPIASIPSYFKLDPKVSLEEIGLEAQARHYQALRAAGDRPLVVQAEDIRADTAKVVGALWQAIGLPPAPQAFDWHGEKPADWQQVEGWHGAVSASSGIRPLTDAELQAQKEIFARLAAEQPRVQALMDHHRPFYEQLKAEALVV